MSRIEGDSQITEVVVYARGAEVTREIEFNTRFCRG
jgi:hypothetical protein